GSIIVVGLTLSVDLPITPGAVQPMSMASFFSGSDAFVARLSGDGSTLLGSTYLGGRLTDDARDVAIGPGNRIFVVGKTKSVDLPVTPGVFQPDFSGDTSSPSPPYEAFVARLTPNLDVLEYLTYLGGSAAEDGGFDIAVDSAGVAVVAGRTSSAFFPFTKGALFEQKASSMTPSSAVSTPPARGCSIRRTSVAPRRKWTTKRSP
ncbi:MAG: Beta-propeller repeat protein, partial [bacterium]